MNVLQDELSIKIKENESLHIKIFEMNREFNTKIDNLNIQMKQQIESKQKFEEETGTKTKEYEEEIKKISTEKEKVEGENQTNLKNYLNMNQLYNNLKSDSSFQISQLNTQFNQLDSLFLKKVPFNDSSLSLLHSYNLPSFSSFKREEEVMKGMMESFGKICKVQTKINNNLCEKMEIKNRNASPTLVSLHKKFITQLKKQNSILENNVQSTFHFPSLFLYKNLCGNNLSEKKEIEISSEEILNKSSEQISFFFKSISELVFSLRKANSYQLLVLQQYNLTQSMSSSLQSSYSHLNLIYSRSSSSLSKLLSHLKLLFFYFFRPSSPFPSSPPFPFSPSKKKSLQNDTLSDSCGEDIFSTFQQNSEKIDFSSQQQLFDVLNQHNKENQSNNYFHKNEENNQENKENNKGTNQENKIDTKHSPLSSSLNSFNSFLFDISLSEQIHISEENIPFIFKQTLSSLSLLKQISLQKVEKLEEILRIEKEERLKTTKNLTENNSDLEKLDKECKESEKDISYEISKIELLMENFVNFSTKKIKSKIRGEEVEHMDSHLTNKKKEMEESVNYLSSINDQVGKNESINYPLSLLLFDNFSSFVSSFQTKQSHIHSLNHQLSLLQKENKNQQIIFSQQKDLLASKQNKINSLMLDLSSFQNNSNNNKKPPSPYGSSSGNHSPYGSSSGNVQPYGSSSNVFESTQNSLLTPSLLPSNLSNNPTPNLSNNNNSNVSNNNSQLSETNLRNNQKIGLLENHSNTNNEMKKEVNKEVSLISFIPSSQPLSNTPTFTPSLTPSNSPFNTPSIQNKSGEGKEITSNDLISFSSLPQMSFKIEETFLVDDPQKTSHSNNSLLNDNNNGSNNKNEKKNCWVALIPLKSWTNLEIILLTLKQRKKVIEKST
eukprot:TRINITY_DN13862_c0_g1_i1.p1 TRINITY_DN13862_c0_g1~~TRINITY_DN13862_c0_g1_i1.p1  ORF type:complete len:996 (+),score=427.22 TRINITY_DN13862_c0_g1_i1:318-2990(+)